MNISVLCPQLRITLWVYHFWVYHRAMIHIITWTIIVIIITIAKGIRLLTTSSSLHLMNSRWLLSRVRIIYKLTMIIELLQLFHHICLRSRSSTNCITLYTIELIITYSVWRKPCHLSHICSIFRID